MRRYRYVEYLGRYVHILDPTQPRPIFIHSSPKNSALPQNLALFRTYSRGIIDLYINLQLKKYCDTYIHPCVHALNWYIYGT